MSRANQSLGLGWLCCALACSSPPPDSGGGGGSGTQGGEAMSSGGATSGAGGAVSSGGSPSGAGGAVSSGGSPSGVGGAVSPGGASSLGGSTTQGGALARGGTVGSGGGPATGRCAVANDRVRITEIDLGKPVVQNEDEAALKLLALSPLPSGGSRLAWMGNDNRVHITELDADDHIVKNTLSLPAHDFGDIYADDRGGVVLLTRDAEGGGTLNCGEPTNLCGTPPSPAVPCYDMYLVRFDGDAEAWATKLTSSSASLPPYSTGKTGADVTMIWWYAHHGRIASDGTNFAAYFGSAISVSQNGCINIHQGDRMKIVDPSGAIAKGGFDWGCSHSGYERIVYDPSAKKYVTVCKNDAATGGLSGKIAFAPNAAAILPVDLNYSNLGNLALAPQGGYWLTTSQIREGQPAKSDGFADVLLLHFTNGAPDVTRVLANSAELNARAPHLSSYGTDSLLAAWETSTTKGDLGPRSANRTLLVQALDATTGEAHGAPVPVAVAGNRYQEFKPYPDGSVAYPAAGSSATKLKILRILPCPG